MLSFQKKEKRLHNEIYCSKYTTSTLVYIYIYIYVHIPQQYDLCFCSLSRLRKSAPSLQFFTQKIFSLENPSARLKHGVDRFNDQRFTQLRECVGEAVRTFPSFNATDVKLAQLYVNTTACVLAKTRCSQMNPITGEFQEDDLANKLHIPTVNAVLVNTDYDINIVQLPFHSSSVDVCAKYRNYEQASWPSVVCWSKKKEFISWVYNSQLTVIKWNINQFVIKWILARAL